MGVKELVHLPDESFFRVITWEHDLSHITWVKSPTDQERTSGEGFRWHYHRALELTCFFTGQGTRFVGDSIEGFEAGDVVLLGENLPHYWHVADSSSGVAIQFLLPPGHPLWSFSELSNLSRLLREASSGLHFDSATSKRMQGVLERIPLTSGVQRLGLLFSLLGEAIESLESGCKRLSSKVFNLDSETSHEEAMRMTVHFILTQYREEIRLEQVLDQAKMSKSTFSRVFRKYLGKNFREFLQEVRLEHVCRELRQTAKPVIEIALGAGFSEITFFNRLFRRTYSCSPTEYRERELEVP
ncbi:MAG: AraC family transcriptional regulator [Puniceicoccaceae bacterium]